MSYQTTTIAFAVFVLFQPNENSQVTNRYGGRPKRTAPTLLALTRGTEHGCGLSADGRAYCWGSNRLGQLGDSDDIPNAKNGAVAVATTETFVSISAGANHTCALTREGVVYCWGLNLTGELGQAIVANRCDGFPCNRRPIRVETSTRFDTISAGFGHTCALRGGRAFCWGRNDQGQLGSARADDRCEGVPCNVSPIRVEGIDGFTSIAAGGDHTCGIAGGALYCWGANQYGQLGADSSIRRTAHPFRVPLTERAVSVSARGLRTCVTTANGRQKCWGFERPGSGIGMRETQKWHSIPSRPAAERAMPTFTIPGRAGPLHVVDLREESPTPSGSMPIVFVHGMVGYAGFWNSTLAAWADRRRAIAVDLRGHGNSGAPRDDAYDVESCANDVEVVLDALRLERVVLVGHSYGAFVTIETAARRPNVVRRLVLVDPPGDFTRVSTEMRDGQIVPFITALEGDQWRSTAEGDFDDALEGSTTGAVAAVHARLATMPRVALLGMYRSMMRYPASEALERYLATPGTSAHAILAPPNAWPFSLHVLVPAVRATVVPDVGHWIMLDAPGRFATALEEAIAGT